MEQLYHTTELIGIKDKNIKILFILKHQTHLEIRAKLDYDSPIVLIAKESVSSTTFKSRQRFRFWIVRAFRPSSCLRNGGFNANLAEK